MKSGKRKCNSGSSMFIIQYVGQLYTCLSFQSILCPVLQKLSSLIYFLFGFK
uniref:Uncharacterized protein n=1 Tax=Octopus bimaculoides TaxID=37653 RepID=A0A0L8IGM3_OCTBM